MDDPEVVERLGVIRFEPNGLLQRLRGFVDAARLAQDFAEIGMIARRLRAELDRPPERRDGVLGAAERRQAHAKDVVGIAIGGTRLDDLAANPLGLRVLAPGIELAGHLDGLGRRHVDPAFLRLGDGVIHRCRSRPPLALLGVGRLGLLLGAGSGPAGGGFGGCPSGRGGGLGVAHDRIFLPGSRRG